MPAKEWALLKSCGFRLVGSGLWGSRFSTCALILSKAPGLLGLELRASIPRLAGNEHDSQTSWNSDGPVVQVDAIDLRETLLRKP